MTKKTLQVYAHWDEQMGRWWADSEDVLGLVTEAITLEELITNIRDLTPELLSLNGKLPSLSDFPIISTELSPSFGFLSRERNLNHPF